MRVHAQRWRDEINEWRFVFDLLVAEKLRFSDVTSTSMSFDASPVVSAL